MASQGEQIHVAMDELDEVQGPVQNRTWNFRFENLRSKTVY
jgi:hypothetical protein